MQGNTEVTADVCTAEATEDMTNGEVFETLQDGDKVLWDQIQTPVTVTSGYVGFKAENGEAPATLMLEGPRGGEKMMTQNKHNPDNVCVDSFSLSSNGTWVNNLRVTERAE